MSVPWEGGQEGLFPLFWLIYSYPVDFHNRHTVDWLVKASGKRNIHWFLGYVGCPGKDLFTVDLPYQFTSGPFKGIDVEPWSIFRSYRRFEHFVGWGEDIKPDLGVWSTAYIYMGCYPVGKQPEGISGWRIAQSDLGSEYSVFLSEAGAGVNNTRRITELFSCESLVGLPYLSVGFSWFGCNPEDAVPGFKVAFGGIGMKVWLNRIVVFKQFVSPVIAGKP